MSSFLIIALLVRFGFLYSNKYEEQSNKQSHVGFVTLYGNGQESKALCFGRSPDRIDKIFFKTHLGTKLVVKFTRDYFTGNATEFFHFHDGKKHEVRKLLNYIFLEQYLPVPIIMEVNGIFFTGLLMQNDGRKSEISFYTKFLKTYNNLPISFKNGLRDFYLFGSNSISGISIIAISLYPIFEKIKPYKILVIPNTNLEAIRSFFKEFDEFQDENE